MIMFPRKIGRFLAVFGLVLGRWLAPRPRVHSSRRLSSNMACVECKTSTFHLIHKFFKNDIEALEEFKAHGVLPPEVTCPTCGNACRFKSSNRSYYCKRITRDSRSRKKVCSFNVSERKGTFLDQVHLKPSEVLLITTLFLSKPRAFRDIVFHLDIHTEAAVNWTSYCYKVCEFWVDQQPELGGPGVIVEIDVCKFWKSKYNKNREVKGKWFFGLFERETKKLLLFPVDKRDATTLIPLIQRHILPGTTIYSAEWCAYKNLNDLGYEHQIVKHKVQVSETGAHIQNIESTWSDAKAWVVQSGNRVCMYPKYLAKYLFSRAYPREEYHHHFLRAAAQLYKHEYSAE